jgi:tetratricopeptide (TPR) repeat protein
MMEQFIDTGQGTGVSTSTLLPMVHDRDEFEATLGKSSDPVDAVVYHLFLGAMDKAEKALDKAIKKGPGPGNFRLRTLAADIQCGRGDYRQAKAMYRHLLDEESGTAREAALHQNLGRVFFAEAEYPTAAECFKTALRLRRRDDAPAGYIRTSEVALRRSEERYRQTVAGAAG